MGLVSQSFRSPKTDYQILWSALKSNNRVKSKKNMSTYQTHLLDVLLNHIKIGKYAVNDDPKDNQGYAPYQ